MTAGGADPYFGVQQGVLVSLANDGSVSVLRFVGYSVNWINSSFFCDFFALFFE